MIEKTIGINVDSKEAENNTKELISAIKELTDESKKANKEASKSTEGIGKKAKKSSKALKFLTGGFKLLGSAIKAAGIGLVIGLIAKLGQVFSQNQKVVDAFSNIMNTISIVFTELTNGIINAFEATSQATGGFDALGKVMSGLLTLVITPLKASFLGIKLAIQQAQLIWEESFLGDGDPETIKNLNKEIAGTKIQLMETAENAVKAGKDIFNNFSEAASEVGSLGENVVEEVGKISVSNAKELAEQLTESRKASALAQVEIQGLIEKYDRQAETQRQIRDDERLSIDERIEANNKLGDILEKQLQEQLNLANERINSAQLEIKATGNNIENEIALKEALNERAAIEAQITGFKSEQRVNEAALERERMEAINAQIESESKLSIERKRFNAEQIEDELRRLEKLKEVDLIEQEQEKKRLQSLVDNANDGTQAKIDAEIRLNEFLEESRQTNLEREKQIKEAEIKIDEKTKNAKISNAQEVGGAISQLSALAGESTAAGKALGIASATIDTYVGANKAIAKGGFVGIAQAVAIIATGLANVKSIVSTKIPQTNVGGVSAGATGGQSAPSQPPQFNIIGQDSNSQLAESIAEQENEPIQAFVVANDVTTAQSLNNNIVEGATL